MTRIWMILVQNLKTWMMRIDFQFNIKKMMIKKMGVVKAPIFCTKNIFKSPLHSNSDYAILYAFFGDGRERDTKTKGWVEKEKMKNLSKAH